MAVADYFLKIEGVEGESQDAKHKNEIQLESWNWTQSQGGSHAGGGGGGAGKVHMEDFHFVMKTNKASPKLFLACASGEHIKSAVLTCRKAGKEQQEYLKIVLSDLLVSSYHFGGDGAATVLPNDHVTINFTKIEYEYKEQKPDGTLGPAVKAGWNLKENQKV
jgi:type VI secretion system secreted protein Hcp